jgi:adenylate kinase
VLLASFVVDIIAMVFGMPHALFPQIAHETFGDPAGGGLALGLLYAAMSVGAVLRRTDKRTGQIYHLKYNPPPFGADLEHRADDQPETVAKRLDAYEAMTAALLPYYKAKGLLRRVDGKLSPSEVNAEILKVLG